MNAPFAHMVLGTFITVGGIGLMLYTRVIARWDWDGVDVPYSLLYAAAGSAATVYGVTTIATAYGDPYHVQAIVLFITLPPVAILQFLMLKKRWKTGDRA